MEAAAPLPVWRSNLATIGALMARAKNELLRVPGAAIPGVLAPTIFFLGLNGVFGALTHLKGFTTGSYENFIVPVSMLQGAGFTGAAAGVNLARDIEQGWLDRLLVSPAPRWVLLAGTVLAASARSLIPATFVLIVALALGANFPGIDGLLVTYFMVAAMAAVAACWGSMLALHFKSQSAAPLMQAGMMALILTTTAYAPLALLQGWLQEAARVNPVTQVIDAARQGFVGGVSWAETWPGLLALVGMLAILGTLALREMRRTRSVSAKASRDRPTLASCAATGWRAQREGVPFAYTRPSPTRYPWQWYWDSCFAAIAWRRFDAARPQAELESLLAAQRPDGFVGHTIFWHRPVSLGRLPFYNVASRNALQTETIQPPLLAWAWRIAVGEPAAEPRIAAQMDWLARNRDLDGDRLLWIIQPDESGLDASPKFDPVWRWQANARIGFPWLVHRNRRLGFDARRIRDRDGPVLCETLVNTMWSLSLQALGAPSATAALIDRLWDERRGLFLDEAQPGRARPGVLTWAALSPLALPDLPEEIGRRLVEEHLLSAREFLTAVAPPSVAASEPSFRARWRPRPDSAATGAARPGSTPPGWSGWGCAASAMRMRRRGSRRA